MTLGAPNTLPNFNCKTITIKNSVSEKLLGIIIDNKFDFTEYLNTVYKKANLELHALNKISSFLVSITACTNNQCLYKISFQLLLVGLIVLLPGDYA